MAKTEPAYQKWELRNGEKCSERKVGTAEYRQLQSKPGWLIGFECLLNTGDKNAATQQPRKTISRGVDDHEEEEDLEKVDAVAAPTPARDEGGSEQQTIINGSTVIGDGDTNHGS
jgi:hypothetical protein